MEFRRALQEDSIRCATHLPFNSPAMSGGTWRERPDGHAILQDIVRALPGEVVGVRTDRVRGTDAKEDGERGFVRRRRARRPGYRAGTLDGASRAWIEARDTKAPKNMSGVTRHFEDK